MNELRRDHKLRVKEIAKMIGGSRQRLSEMRRTAEAFPPAQRWREVDHHYYEVARRAAHRLGSSPVKVLDDVIRKGYDSSRKATSYLAKKIDIQENARAAGKAGIIAARHGQIIDHCHQGDFRQLIRRLDGGMVKLIMADLPYGAYGQYRDGKHTASGAARRGADNTTNAAARRLTVNLFKLALPKLAGDGCLILFRPGGHVDPPWLLTSAEEAGWHCDHALVWHKGHVQLGSGRTAYGVATERLLVFTRPGVQVRNHDGSGRSDMIRIAPVRPRYTTGHTHHLFEKPLELARFLIKKHTYKGEVVLDPCGASGNFCIAAAALGRRWIYCESNKDNFDWGSQRIARALASASRAAG